MLRQIVEFSCLGSVKPLIKAHRGFILLLWSLRLYIGITIGIIFSLFYGSFVFWQQVYGLEEVPLKANPNSVGKWAGFGIGFKGFGIYVPRIYTEIQGTIIYRDPNGDLYILPDQNYRNLLLPGNSIIPSCPVDVKGGINPACPKADFDWWYHNICLNYQLIFKKVPCAVGAIPVVKAELYSVAGWTNDDTLPVANRPDLSTVNPGNVFGKHVKLYGLYLQEFQHNMYQDVVNAPGSCTVPFIVKPWKQLEQMRCYGHAELHPYLSSYIFDSPEPLAGGKNTETHTVVAPFYTQYYSDTYGINKLTGVDAHLDNENSKTNVVNHFFMKAPPKPSECSSVACELHFEESNVMRFGSAQSGSRVDEITPQGAIITVFAHGESIKNPTIFQATWSVFWKRATPVTIITSAIDGNGNHIVEGGQTKSNSMTFGFTSAIRNIQQSRLGQLDNVHRSEDISFECKIDDAIWLACFSPHTENGLKQNSDHKFEVRAIRQGIRDAPATWGWTVGIPKQGPCQPNNKSPNCIVNRVSTCNPLPPQKCTPQQAPVMNKSFFIIFKGSTTKLTADRNIMASTSGTFSLNMDSAKLVSGDNTGTAVGSGRVQIKISDTEGCTYEYKGFYEIHGKLTYNTYSTTEHPQGRILAITGAQPELTALSDPYESPPRKDVIFVPKVSGSTSCSNTYSSGYSPMLWCNEGAADLDINLRIGTTKLQRNGENQECTFSLGSYLQKH